MIPDEGKAKKLRAGFKLVSLALFVYAGSAFASAASAGSFVAAILTSQRGDPVTGVFDFAGGIAIRIGAAVAGTSLVLLAVGFALLKKGRESVGTEVAAALSASRLMLSFAYLFLAVAGPLVVVSAFFKGGGTLLQLAVVMSGVAALAFLGAVAVPAVVLPGLSRRRIAMVATGIGAAAVLAELFLALQSSTVLRDPIWLTLGGYPLINWNLPFGVLVGISSLMLWWSYRQLGGDYFR